MKFDDQDLANIYESGRVDLAKNCAIVTRSDLHAAGLRAVRDAVIADCEWIYTRASTARREARAVAETLRDRWNRMTLDEKRRLAPSGRACVDCGEPAGTPWGPNWCPDCDDKRVARIDAGLRKIAEGFERQGAKGGERG